MGSANYGATSGSAAARRLVRSGMQGERVAFPQIELEGTRSHVGTLPATRGNRLEWLALIATPIRLAVVQVLAVTVFVVVTLAPPDPRPGFLGLSGDTNNWRAYYRLGTWTGGLGQFGHFLTSINLPTGLYLWILRSAFVLLALTHLVALIACLRQVGAGERSLAWRWLIGPALTSLVLLAYPPLCSDVFYYAMSGHVANAGGNPYQYPLARFTSDPLLPFQDWSGISSPYGPLWTTISRGIVAITGSDPVTAVLGFKLFAVFCALGLAGITYLLARRLTDDRRLRVGALVLTAWQPVLLVESAGSSHNDSLMMLLALGGLLVVTTPRRGMIRTGLLLIAASALIKYVTLPLLAYAALWRLRSLGPTVPWRRVIGQWIADAMAAVALAAAVFAPYWVGVTTLRSLIAQSGRLVTSTLWLVPAWEFNRGFSAAGGGQLDNVGTDITSVAPYIMLPVLAVVVVATLRRLGPAMRATCQKASPSAAETPGLAAQVTAWSMTTVFLAFIPMNTHSWYAIWTIPLAALMWISRSRSVPPAVSSLLEEPSPDEDKGEPILLPRWLVLFFVWLVINFLVYHTTVVR